jgi:hypothetical protein
MSLQSRLTAHAERVVEEDGGCNFNVALSSDVAVVACLCSSCIERVLRFLVKGWLCSCFCVSVLTMFVCNSDLVSYGKSQCHEVEIATTMVLCVNIWQLSLPNAGWIFGYCRRPCFADWIMQLELTIIEAIASYGRDASLRHGFVWKSEKVSSWPHASSPWFLELCRNQ